MKPGYTNIFLMHCWNLMAIGEATDRPDAAQEGYKALDDWLLHTSRNGISEYLSPTYYGVDLECLGLIARHIKDESAREKAEKALRLFWTDIAANWFEPCGRLGGAHNRDYDYLTGHGMRDRHIRAAGWLPPAPTGTMDELCKWIPPPSIVSSFKDMVPRIVCQRWSGRPWESAVHYRGRSVDIGSAGACKGPEDKAFTFQFAGGPRRVMGNFVVDGRGDPYGVNKATTGGGHMKSHHLVPFVVSVQRGPEVLLLASDASRTGRSGNVQWQLTTMATNIVFPAGAKVFLEDGPAGLPGEGKETVLPAGRPVFLRYGDAAVGLRFVLATDTAGRPAPLRWVNDGSKYGASRLVCVHSEGPPAGRGTTAVWARAGEGMDEAAFASSARRFAAARAGAEVSGAWASGSNARGGRSEPAACSWPDVPPAGDRRSRAPDPNVRPSQGRPGDRRCSPPIPPRCNSISVLSWDNRASGRSRPRRSPSASGCNAARARALGSRTTSCRVSIGLR